jgi:hypothetical protein
MVERCPVCGKDWRFPLNHRECVETLQARVLALDADKDVLMEQGESIARERDDLRLRVAVLEQDLERFEKKDGLRTREHNLLVQENRALIQERDALRVALLELMEALPPDPRWHAAMSKAMIVMRASDTVER